MKILKTAYKVCRKNSEDIYKGFGFKHLSDVTAYYVHPDNQSPNGTTTLAQPIGEAILLFTTFLKAIMDGKPVGDYYYSDDWETIYLTIEVPEDYHIHDVIDEKIHSYRSLLKKDTIYIAAYDENDRLCEGNMDHLRPLYKMLPMLMVLLARELERNQEYENTFESFISNPHADTFVNLHEDFYQNNKLDEYEVYYQDFPFTNVDSYESFSQKYQIVKENKQEVLTAKEVIIDRFSENEFTKEQLSLIPNLPSEFIIPENLKESANAIQHGDVLSALIHGPAGTGKTMSCKLICQNIGLPIMETVNCTENLDEFVLGKYIPEEDRIIFKESYVTKAVRYGGAVVFEEINFAKPQYLAFLNSLLDDNGFVRLDNGEIIQRHKNFRFFATMNIGYFGTKELNQALYNRFNNIIEIASLSDEAISRMLITRVPECEEFVPKILGVYHKIKNKIEKEELDFVISPRNLENWARMAKYESYIKAAENTIIPVAKCDRSFEDTIRGILMLYRWK